MTSLRRVQFRAGDRLQARDLTDDAAAGPFLRGIHVLGLHGTWGVAAGLDVAVDPAVPGRVVVGPGLAYDRRGREILIEADTAIGAPRLLVGADDTLFDLACAAGSPVVLRWRPVRVDGSSDPGEVVLGRFLVSAEPTVTVATLEVRHVARRLLRPALAAGRASGLGWKHQPSRGSFRASVDTSAAGFSIDPHYFVAVANEPFPVPPSHPGPFVEVVEGDRHEFTVDLRFLGTSDDDDPADSVVHVELAWLGVEPVVGCPPLFHFLLEGVFP